MWFDTSLLYYVSLKLVIPQIDTNERVHLTDHGKIPLEISSHNFKKKSALEIMHKVQIHIQGGNRVLPDFFFFILKHQIHFDHVLSIWNFYKGYQRDQCVTVLLFVLFVFVLFYRLNHLKLYCHNLFFLKGE